MPLKPTRRLQAKDAAMGGHMARQRVYMAYHNIDPLMALQGWNWRAAMACYCIPKADKEIA